MHWKGRKIDSDRCLHCGAQFKLARDGKSIVLCGCSSSTPSSIDLARFQSAFKSTRAEQEYGSYKKKKVAAWKPINPDTGSLESCIARYGEKIGTEKFEARCKSKSTTSISYFMKKASGNLEIAKNMQKSRQSVGAVEKFVERYGLDEGVSKWISRNKRWSQTMTVKREIARTSCIPVELIDERNRKLQYDYCCGVLTKLAVRMFEEMIPSSTSANTGARHLDHQYSKAAAIINRKDLKVICSPFNLKWLSESENLAKKSICAISYEELESRYNEWYEGKHFNDICEALLRHWRSEGMQV